MSDEPSGYNYKATVTVSGTCKETGKPFERSFAVDYYAGRHEPDVDSAVKKILRKAVAA